MQGHDCVHTPSKVTRPATGHVRARDSGEHRRHAQECACVSHSKTPTHYITTVPFWVVTSTAHMIRILNGFMDLSRHCGFGCNDGSFQFPMFKRHEYAAGPVNEDSHWKLVGFMGDFGGWPAPTSTGGLLLHRMSLQ